MTKTNNKSLYERFFKRFFDMIFSFLGLIMISPIFIVLFIIVRIRHGKPVIFKQDRPGKDEKIFTMYKFRTMTNKKDIFGKLLPDKERLTKFGMFLRKTSLDELPELWNILKGDMSFVGPRPLLVEYLEKYSDEQKKRHLVRPGITGLAQVNGRNSISWDEKFVYDNRYIQNVKLKTDLPILVKTFWVVIKRSNISPENSVTAKLFQGNKKVEIKK